MKLTKLAIFLLGLLLMVGCKSNEEKLLEGMWAISTDEFYVNGERKGGCILMNTFHIKEDGYMDFAMFNEDCFKAFNTKSMTWKLDVQSEKTILRLYSDNEYLDDDFILEMWKGKESGLHHMKLTSDKLSFESTKWPLLSPEEMRLFNELPEK